MARDGDDRLQSVTLLAAQTDFTEAGELMLFINESQVAFLEDMMWEQGFLDATQMAGAFQMLHSSDLISSRMVHDYLMGERTPMIDLMAWNADATRMPYRMHSEYLRRLFLNNDLTEGRYLVDDKPISLTDMRVPIFAVGTVQDHVAPWRSTYKINFLTDADVTYLLASGGHNAGIVSEPGHDRRGFQVQTRKADARYVDAETFLAQAHGMTARGGRNGRLGLRRARASRSIRRQWAGRIASRLPRRRAATCCSSERAALRAVNFEAFDSEGEMRWSRLTYHNAPV